MAQPPTSELLAQAKALPPTGCEARYWEVVGDILERVKEVLYNPENAQQCISVDHANKIVEILELPRAPRAEKFKSYFGSLVPETLKDLYFYLDKVLDALRFFIEGGDDGDSETHAAFRLIICDFLSPLLKLQEEGVTVEPGIRHSEVTVKAEPPSN
ncbi:hypothetical protein PGQ11_010261 [Apiospora arundinis]|uniref:Uncharacterized protein n=1 Tax=Apiospora arundinis TaxID=335852 RepID=A0ABR2IA85_9PEZI